MDKLEQIKCLCDVMKDTECEIDWQKNVANIDFINNDGRFRIIVSADEAKECLEDYLEEVKIMIKDFEGIAMKLEALLLLKAIKKN